jgi:predicted  nucleic acid-binding Zn-ribbon protein
MSTSEDDPNKQDPPADDSRQTPDPPDPDEPSREEELETRLRSTRRQLEDVQRELAEAKRQPATPQQQDDVEALKRRVGELETQLTEKDDALTKAQRTRLMDKAESIAEDLGAIDPPLVVAQLDADTVDLEDARAVRRALRSILDKKPYLAGERVDRHDAGAGRGQRSAGGKTDMNSLLRGGG